MYEKDGPRYRQGYAGGSYELQHEISKDSDHDELIEHRAHSERRLRIQVLQGHQRSPKRLSKMLTPREELRVLVLAQEEYATYARHQSLTKSRRVKTHSEEPLRMPTWPRDHDEQNLPPRLPLRLSDPHPVYRGNNRTTQEHDVAPMLPRRNTEFTMDQSSSSEDTISRTLSTKENANQESSNEASVPLPCCI